MSDGRKSTVRLKLAGREYVVLPREEYERLTGLARVAELPVLPEPDEGGNYPAVDYARASIARSVVRERVEAGLSQRDLARLAGVRAETLCRIETGKHTASTATIVKLEQALKRAAKGKPGRVGKQVRKSKGKRKNAS
jgi:DNA-binding XRE family transcriptional regulator